MIIPSAIQNGELIIRGSQAWDDREQYRKLLGNRCLSFGTIEESHRTHGGSAIGFREKRR